ncbi:hybrid sensor histidine kinase/response regulator [Oculatella sp. LEGE 06141]|nr:response regulator [Oculatella sp. LEGE 06141]MBE9181164.1 hybrid sensor histidine kinase/response regulator [Oculatella sp. LEGE 06141]
MTTSSDSVRILLVDDNPTNLKVLSEAVRDEHWTTLVATDGESAIEQTEYARPDLILLDVMMPGIDGFETCRRLKMKDETQAIPVIFMTALSDVVDKVKGLELGAVDYITKPFQQEEVLARVKLHLKLYHLTQRLAEQNALLNQKIVEQATTEAQLQQLNQELEVRVEQRTQELSDFLHQLQQAQLQLVQSEKMSTLGQLVAGVAHEINNPVGFINGNLKCIQEYTHDLLNHLHLYRQKYPNPDPEIEEHAEEMDLEFVLEDLPKLAASMQAGTDRIRNISTSLRTFSRSDTSSKIAFNLHEGLDSTLLILRHRLKANEMRPEIEIIKDYGKLPLVNCYPGQLNQVFMNILSNAIDALDESSHMRSFVEIEANPNQIMIRTEVSADNQMVKIHIEDNGPGISSEVKEKIFEHLFTTKAVGCGTGLGLSISRQIVVEKHGGHISCDSQPGKGTEFTIEIPALLSE